MSTSRSSSKDATMTNAIQRPVKGVLGEKLGMTQVWNAENRLVPVTVIKAGPCVVTQVRNADKDGYDAVQIAFGAIDSHKNHRKPGSIGACATPGRVFKGHRMAGRMGVVRQTTQNLTIHAVDADRGLLLIKGAVPGPRGGIVLVRTAAKGA